MSTGGGEILGRGTIPVDADTSAYDQAMADLPRKAQAKIKDAMSAIRREMQANSAGVASAMLDQKSAKSGGLEGMSQYYKAQEAIDQFRAANERLRAQMDLVTQAAVRQAGPIQAAAAAKRAAAEATRQLAAAEDRQALAARQAAAATADAMQQVGSASGNAGHKVMQLGQTLDDLQYVPEMGLRPIINNVMQLDARVGIALIAAQLLYENWGKLTGLFGSGAILSEAEEMDKLAKATQRTADEEERYQKLKERSKHREAQDEAPEAVTAHKQQIDRAIQNGPKAEIDKGIDKHFGEHIQRVADADPKLVKAREEAKFWADKVKEWEKAGVGPDNGNLRAYKAKAEATERAAKDQNNKSYAEARERFRNDLGNPDQAGNAKKLKQAASNNPDDFGPNGKEFARALPRSSGDPVKDAAEEKKIADEIAQDRRDREAARQQKEFDAQQQEKSADRQNAQLDVFEEQYRKEKADEKASEEYYAQQDAERGGPGQHGSRLAEWEDGNRQKRAEQEIGGNFEKFGKNVETGLLGRIARGENIDRDELKHQLTAKLQAAGYDNAGEIAEQQTDKLLKAAEDRIKERQLSTGVDRRTAAGGEMAEDVREAKAKLPNLGGITDASSFHQEVQDSILKSNPNEILADETRKNTEQARAMTKALADTTAALNAMKRGVPARFP